MSRSRRWSRRVALTAVILVIAGLLIHAYVLPRVVESKLRDALRRAGFRDAAVTVLRLDTNSANLSHVELAGTDEPGVTIDSLAVTFNLSELLRQSKLRTIEISGATWRIHAGADKLDLGLPSPEGGGGAGDLPFHDLTLLHSRIELVVAGQTFRLPLEASIESTPGGGARVRSRFDAAASPVFLDARISPPDEPPIVLYSTTGAAAASSPATAPAPPGKRNITGRLAVPLLSKGIGFGVGFDRAGNVSASAELLPTGERYVFAADGRSGFLPGLIPMDNRPPQPVHARIGYQHLPSQGADRLAIDAGASSAGFSPEQVRAALALLGIEASDDLRADVRVSLDLHRTTMGWVRSKTGEADSFRVTLNAAKLAARPLGIAASDLHVHLSLLSDEASAGFTLSDDSAITFADLALPLAGFVVEQNKVVARTGVSLNEKSNGALFEGDFVTERPIKARLGERVIEADSPRLALQVGRDGFDASARFKTLTCSRPGHETVTLTAPVFTLAGRGAAVAPKEPAASQLVASVGVGSVDLRTPASPEAPRWTLGNGTATLFFEDGINRGTLVLRADSVAGDAADRAWSARFRGVGANAKIEGRRIELLAGVDKSGITEHESKLELGKATGEATFTLGEKGTQATVSAVINSLAASAPPGPAATRPAGAATQPAGDGPSWNFASARAAFKGSFDAPADGASSANIELTATDSKVTGPDALAVTLPTAAWRGSARSDADGRWSLRGRLDASDADVAVPARKIAVRGIDLAAPVLVNVPREIEAAPAGEVRVRRIDADGVHAWGDKENPAIAGSARLIDGVAHAKLHAKPLGSARLDADLSLDLRTGDGDATLTLPRFRIADLASLAPLQKPLENLTLTGDASARGAVRFARFLPQPDLTLALHDAGVASTQLGLDVRGLNGELRLLGSALVSPGAQKLTIDSLHFSELQLKQGVIEYKLEDPRALMIERMKWTLRDGGELRTFALRLRPGEATFDIDLYFEDLSVAEFLSLATRGQVEGEGRMHGRIPVMLSLEPGRESVKLGRGYLYAVPRPGWVKFEGGKPMMKQLIDQVLPDVIPGGDAAVGDLRSRIAEALVDFEYSQFRFDLVEENGEMIGRLQTSGKGRREPPIPIGGLTVNIRNLNENLIELLKGYEWYGALTRTLGARLEGRGAPATQRKESQP